MSDWLIKLLEQWEVIARAPLPFFIALVVASAIIWIVLSYSYRTRLSNRASEIALVTRQRDDYRDKLGGASPDEAKRKMEELEKRVKETIGSRWEPLTKDEAARLSAAVAKLEKRRIQVMFANQLGKALARSIADAFETAGWNDTRFSEGGGLEIGISTGRGNGLALKLKEAIEASTRFKNVHSFGPTEPDIPGIVFVGVGINPD